MAFSLERLIAVYFPLKLTSICSKNKTHFTIIFLILFSLVFYSFTFITSGLDLHGKETNCVTLEVWFQFVTSMVLIDVGITTMIPFCLITFLNLLIAIKLRNMPKLEVSISANRKISRNLLKASNECSVTTNLMLKVNSHCPRLQKKNNRAKAYTEATKTLLIISLVFLILHFPLATNKVWYFISENISKLDDEILEDYSNLNDYNNNKNNTVNTTALNEMPVKLESSEYEEIFERITCYIFYLNFSLNFFLYTYNKSKFRRIILNSFRKNCLYKWF